MQVGKVYDQQLILIYLSIAIICQLLDEGLLYIAPAFAIRIRDMNDVSQQKVLLVEEVDER